MIDQISPNVHILSRIQGEIFEESVKAGFDSLKFISLFMNSETAWHLDLPNHKASWCGKGYIVDEFFRTATPPSGKTWGSDLMFWIGYIYRFWHYHTGQYSKDIFESVPPMKMREVYPRICGFPPREAVRFLSSVS